MQLTILTGVMKMKHEYAQQDLMTAYGEDALRQIMDWKYKHFHQERVFPAPREFVFEAARTFMAESLGWQITK